MVLRCAHDVCPSLSSTDAHGSRIASSETLHVGFSIANWHDSQGQHRGNLPTSIPVASPLHLLAQWLVLEIARFHECRLCDVLVRNPSLITNCFYLVILSGSCSIYPGSYDNAKCPRTRAPYQETAAAVRWQDNYSQEYPFALCPGIRNVGGHPRSIVSPVALRVSNRISQPMAPKICVPAPGPGLAALATFATDCVG